MAVAFLMSSAVKRLPTPACPLVSTLILIPAALPACLSFSSAIKVWAIPVGQAVTAKT